MYQLKSLFDFDFKRFDNIEILKLLVDASTSLSFIKGKISSIPNPNILLNTLTLQESKTSNEVEGIITTNDLLLQSKEINENIDPSTKEVLRYHDALTIGMESLKEKKGLITNSIIIKIQNVLKDTNNGFRTLEGTALYNNYKEIIYNPPQNSEEIKYLMDDLEKFINDSNNIQCNPLIKLAIIHHQFESIHPFTDGNGRTGRILNSLYLVKEKLLPLPVLYLSRYFVRNKTLYYELLQKVRDEDAWEEWVLYFLKGIYTISNRASVIIRAIYDLMKEYQSIIQDKHSFYKQDLVNALFEHPYITIENLRKRLGCSGPTAKKYLEALCQDKLLIKKKKGNKYIYINIELYNIFEDMDPIDKN